jgi:hypothetical protein
MFGTGHNDTPSPTRPDSGELLRLDGPPPVPARRTSTATSAQAAATAAAPPHTSRQFRLTLQIRTALHHKSVQYRLGC